MQIVPPLQVICPGEICVEIFVGIERRIFYAHVVGMLLRTLVLLGTYMFILYASS